MIALAIRHKITGLFMVDSPRYISWSIIGRTWFNLSSIKGHMTRVKNLIPEFKHVVTNQKNLSQPTYDWQLDQANLDPNEWEIVKVKMVVDDTP